MSTVAWVRRTSGMSAGRRRRRRRWAGIIRPSKMRGGFFKSKTQHYKDFPGCGGRLASAAAPAALMMLVWFLKVSSCNSGELLPLSWFVTKTSRAARTLSWPCSLGKRCYWECEGDQSSAMAWKWLVASLVAPRRERTSLVRFKIGFACPWERIGEVYKLHVLGNLFRADWTGRYS